MESYNRGLLVKKIYDSGLSMFNIHILKNILEIKKENTLLLIISSLVKNGILQKIEKGKFFITSKPPDDFSLAYFLYQPSYISLETSLNLHGILSQFPYEITSVTTKKKREKLVSFWHTGEKGEKIFIYLHIKTSLFWGYFKKNNSLIAEPEKAILDTLYFASKGEREFNFDELNFSSIDKIKLFSYAKKFPQTRQFVKYFDKFKRYL